ncbi:MAG: D-TA family PLP-dependent enzyme [Prolixibacteraceae bacterium]|nr:D-TA family PLP-dependent enzyme [Prolixibacteraceae bacterium]
MDRTDSVGQLWYIPGNVDQVNSPALMIFPDRIRENISRMIDMAGDVKRLRPHVKTHKMAEVVKMQTDQGIYKFKCATIAEAEMIAAGGGRDILLAIQPAGPNIERFFRLKREFSEVKISCIADSEDIILRLSDLAVRTGLETSVWLDINNGMNRTGISPGDEALRLMNLINDLPMIKAGGLHVYDGHIHDKDFSQRQDVCNEAWLPVKHFIERLKKAGMDNPDIIAGGTPTFPVHVLREEVDCSPGTVILWDYSYSHSYADMNFLHAAVLLSRVISKPAKDLICVDLGTKAVASEMPQPRVKILNIENYKIIGQSEEHLVIETPEASGFKVGDPVYHIPWHICPTVDRHDVVSVVEEGMVTGQWSVTARRRKINI